MIHGSYANNKKKSGEEDETGNFFLWIITKKSEHVTRKNETRKRKVKVEVILLPYRVGESEGKCVHCFAWQLLTTITERLQQTFAAFFKRDVCNKFSIHQHSFSQHQTSFESTLTSLQFFQFSFLVTSSVVATLSFFGLLSTSQLSYRKASRGWKILRVLYSTLEQVLIQLLMFFEFTWMEEMWYQAYLILFPLISKFVQAPWCKIFHLRYRYFSVIRSLTMFRAVKSLKLPTTNCWSAQHQNTKLFSLVFRYRLLFPFHSHFVATL